MVAMNRLAANANVSTSRRFILLPEETACGAPQGMRVRRYKLASIGRAAGSQGAGPVGGDLARDPVDRGVGRTGTQLQ